ncbi:uncharacterized protein LOC119106078 [Pollicipes pollicipes]|uniref:uncharacterized protein LOC119106078 n=1 Tax=Pollicipes pollicipes TaxID=41117 RepID=UPI00188512CA|nr:uncharacterized protein LOC119106078 [Pollicipes pollicipes]
MDPPMSRTRIPPPREAPGNEAVWVSAGIHRFPMGSASGGEEMSIKQRAANGDRHSSSRSYLLSTNMKLLVLLAVLGAASAQYQLYTGAVPYTGYNVPLAYNAYHAPIATYAAHPFVYHSLPYSFKPVEKEEPAC